MITNTSIVLSIVLHTCHQIQDIPIMSIILGMLKCCKINNDMASIVKIHPDFRNGKTWK